MIIYNSVDENKSDTSYKINPIDSDSGKPISTATTSSFNKKKLTRDNRKFLQSLGFKVK